MAGDSNMMYLIHCKNFCKCYNVPHPAQKKNDSEIDGWVKQMKEQTEGRDKFLFRGRLRDS
jgi:hypothetical protein